MLEVLQEWTRGRGHLRPVETNVALPGVVAYDTDLRASLPMAVLSCVSEHFRHMSLADRMAALSALLARGLPQTLDALCYALKVEALIVLTCKPASGKRALRLQTAFGPMYAGPTVVLVSDGNGLLWLPASVSGQFVLSPEAATNVARLTDAGPCASYKPGAAVLWKRTMWHVVKHVGQKLLIEDSNDSSRQTIVMPTDLTGTSDSVVAGPNMLRNRAEEARRRMTGSVAPYEHVRFSVYRFKDYVHDAAEQFQNDEAQYGGLLV